MTEKPGLAKGLIIFREQLKQPMKDADNPFFKSKYVPLEAVTDAIDSAIVGTGLTYICRPKQNDRGQNGTQVIILHESGEELDCGTFYLPASKNDPQGYGSASTYSRRYALSTVFNITSDVDDDGNKAVATIEADNLKQIESQLLEVAELTGKTQDELKESLVEKLGVKDLKKLNASKQQLAFGTLKIWVMKAKEKMQEKSENK